MDPFIVSVLILISLTVISVFWFKKSFFKIKDPKDLFDKNATEFDKALMTKDPDIAIFKHRRYFSAVAGFITMLFIVVFVEYPTLLEVLEEKLDAKAVMSQTQDIEVTEQTPEKPKVKQKKAAREEVVDEPVEMDTTIQKELEAFVPDFNEPEEEDDDEEEYIPPIVDRAEVRATFPGGNGAFMKWAYNNIVISDADKQSGVRGMVMVQFVVYEDGYVRDVEIVKGINKTVDASVKKLFNSSPKWKPGSTQGQTVRERWRYPIKIVPK